VVLALVVLCDVFDFDPPQPEIKTAPAPPKPTKNARRFRRSPERPSVVARMPAALLVVPEPLDHLAVAPDVWSEQEHLEIVRAREASLLSVRAAALDCHVLDGSGILLRNSHRLDRNRSRVLRDRSAYASSRIGDGSLDVSQFAD